jgi:secreted trypsin-like serine protease
MFIAAQAQTSSWVDNQSRFVQQKCGRTARSASFHSNKRTGFFLNFFNSMLSRIINGVESRPNGWPWLVSIGVRYRGPTGLWQNRTHICGGTLIENSHVLTAAHCLEQKIDDRYVPFTSTNPSLESFFVLRIGIHDIRYTRSEELYGARRIFVHERFVSSTFENDIAIIRLDRPVIATEHTSPICLPSNNLSPGLQVTVAGWGTVAETSRVHSNVLRQANVNILPATNCRVYNDVHYDTTKQLCAAAVDWSKDTWYDFFFLK